MSKFYVLDFKTKHFTEDLFFDLKVLEDENTKKIRTVTLISKSLNLSEITLTFNYVFDEFKHRPFLISNMSWPVFSAELINIMEQFDHDCLFIDTRIILKNETVLTNYSAVQIPKIKNTLDLKKSKFTADLMFPDTFGVVEQMKIRPDEKLPSIFRPFEYASAIIINSQLNDAIPKKYIDELIIIPLEDFNSFSNYS